MHCLGSLVLETNPLRGLEPSFSVHLRRNVSTFCVFFFVGFKALFIDQPTLEKYVNNILPFKKYFVIMFSTITFQFLIK